MGRKNSLAYNQELNKLILQYETAQAEGKQLYLDADQLADIADRYAAERRFTDAQNVINYGLYLHSGNTDLMLEQAYLYLDTQMLDMAKEMADKITEEYNADVKLLKAEIFLSEGLLEAAQNILNTINESDDLETMINIVYLFLDMGYPEEAKEWLDKGKSLYNENEDFIAVKADYLMRTNHLDTAIDHYERLIDMDSYNPAYWMGIAKCRFAKEECDKAIEACDFALAADDKCGEAYAYRAHSYFYLNNQEEAMSNYQKAMEYKAIPPEMGYMFIGMGHSNREEWKEAYECYLKVIQLFEKNNDENSPLLPDTYANAAVAAAKLGNYEEAHLFCDKGKQINPDDYVIFITEGKLYLEEKAEKKARKSFQKALKIEAGPDSMYQIACAFSDADELITAKLYFEEVYKLDPDFLDVTERLSVLCLMHNEIDNFFKYNQECARPINEDIILELLSQKDSSDEGIKLLQEVLERMRKENNKD